MSGIIKQLYEVVGLGKFDDNSHPIHPSTVHFPIAFLALHYGLDCLYGLAIYPATAPFLAFTKPYISDITRISWFMNVLGLITALPAIATGVAEMWALIESNGIWEKIKRESDGKEVYNGINPKTYHVLAHAALNDIAFVFSLVDAVQRSGNEDFYPTNFHITLSALTLPGLLFSAYLGGALVYKYGVGVQRMGEAVAIKNDQGRDELKKRDGYTLVKERKGQ